MSNSNPQYNVPPPAEQPSALIRLAAQRSTEEVPNSVQPDFSGPVQPDPFALVTWGLGFSSR